MPTYLGLCTTTRASIKQHLDMLHFVNFFRLYLVFQEMRAAGIQPDAVVYNTLINACALCGDYQRALETLETMRIGG